MPKFTEKTVTGVFLFTNITLFWLILRKLHLNYVSHRDIIRTALPDEEHTEKYPFRFAQ